MTAYRSKTGMSRRALLRRASAMAVLSFARPAKAGWFATRPKFRDYPFKLGVASGDPISDGFVIWTRMAPEPLDPEGMTEPVRIGWEVARDEGFNDIVRTGDKIAVPDHAHSVHVELRNLAPGRPYWYRFHAGGETSPVGRAVTAPVVGSPLERLRLAVMSCQHYEEGYFLAYRDAVAREPDYYVHLGDYIYEYTGGERVRRHPVEEAYSLADYRALHATYKLDPDLQAAHAQAPWLFTWDDHEVENDYARDRSNDFRDPAEFLQRRAAAYKALYEHMPLRRIARPTDEGVRLYQQAVFGDLAEINLLDVRQYRDYPVCPTPEAFTRVMPLTEDCAALNDETRTMLGADQERWLGYNLAREGARWTVLAQPLMFADLRQKSWDGTYEGIWTDDWKGYPPARRRLIDMLRTKEASNPVILGGDIHSYWVNDVHAESFDTDSPLIASEFVTTSVTSRGVDYDNYASMLPRNPHVRYFESRYRGYLFADIDHERWRSDLRIADDIRKPDSGFKTLRAFAVEAGNPGAREIDSG